MREGVLFIGYGNPLRGDDSAGPLAAHRLAERGFLALAVHQLTPELAERLAGAHTVVFLDADAFLRPGAIAIEALTSGPASRPFEHDASPAGLLRLARTAYGAEPASWLIRIGGENFGFGEGLLASAETALSHAVEAAASLIASR